jgi:uncharacterized protein YaeQ
MEFRVSLANVDRGVERNEPVILARHPSETMERVVLRVLAWCILNEEGITFGPGLCEPESPDLFVRDVDRYKTWIACSSAKWETLRRAIRANAGVAAHVVLSDPRRRDDLLAEIADGPKEARALTIWTIDRALVTSLAGNDARRRPWNVTISGEHCYVEEGNVTFDGAITSQTQTQPTR